MVVVIVVVVTLMILNRTLSPRRTALFVQGRVGREGKTLRVVKIRSMLGGMSRGAGLRPTTACTSFGRFIRRYYLDELPQLIQVLTGQLSLVGIRVLPRDVYDGLAVSWSSERFKKWQEMYSTAPLGLTGAHQVLRGAAKHDARRYHRDMFYVRRAGLGLDLYLLWRTIGTGDHEHDRAPRTGKDMQRLVLPQPVRLGNPQSS
jgi:sugar transferase EpsL